MPELFDCFADENILFLPRYKESIVVDLVDDYVFFGDATLFVDNGVDYPGGNDHGSICCIKGQWYIFYHRMNKNSNLSILGG